MPSSLVLSTLLLASSWLPSVFGVTPCTIPWYNAGNPPRSRLSGYCVPKGDREACPHAALLPASPGGCQSMSRYSPLMEARWHEAQAILPNREEVWLSRNAVFLSNVGRREDLRPKHWSWALRTWNELLLEPFAKRLRDNRRGLAIVRIPWMFFLTWQTVWW